MALKGHKAMVRRALSSQINGGRGNDLLIGGDGSDIFVIGDDNEPAGAYQGDDTVTDFSKDDMLKVSDRNGDGDFDTEDYDIVREGDDAVIKFKDSSGSDNGSVTLEGQGDAVDNDQIKLDTEDDDGFFTI